MKKLQGIICCAWTILSFMSTHGQDFAKGADIGWLSQMEASGRKFYNSSGVQQDCIQTLKDKAVNAIRLRVWVNPTAGWCGTADVVAQAVRAQNMGMRIMIDFHYSDSWADPGKQTKPAAWKNLDFNALVTALYNYTFDVMTTLKSSGVTPEWVQVGNETNNGMLWDDGKASVNMGNYAKLVSAGYDAVKAVSSTSKVVVHISNGYDNSLFRWIFDGLTSNGARWDVIGMSLYPTTANWSSLNNQCLANMNDMTARYNKEIMICEVGMDVGPAPTCKAFLRDLISKTRSLAGKKGLGVFYWEPEAYNGWQGYSKVAFDLTGKPTVAMDAFLEGGTPAPVVNYLANASFDADGVATQTPQAWNKTGTVAASSTSSGGGWNADGSFYLGHYLASAYQVRTFQTVSVPNGHYSLSAWAIRGNGQNSCQMVASGFGGPDVTVNIPYNNAWSPVSIPDINVTNGQATIGFWSDANAGNWMDIDGVVLTNMGSLPVSLITYNALPQPDGRVRISWRTASETANSHYTLQRSTDGNNFTQIGQVQGKGTTGAAADYVFFDPAPVPQSANYYRLLQTDIDGKTTSLGVQLVMAGATKNGFSVYPNPAANGISIKHPGWAGKVITLRVVNVEGRTLLSQRFTASGEERKIDVSAVPPGQYFIHISGNGIHESRKIIIQ